MTLKEAIGVHRCDIDIKTGERLTHSDIYGRAIDLLGGLDVVAPYIPFPLDDIRKALKTDPHLNGGIPVRRVRESPSRAGRVPTHRRWSVESVPSARYHGRKLRGGRVHPERSRSAAGGPRGWRQWISSFSPERISRP